MRVLPKESSGLEADKKAMATATFDLQQFPKVLHLNEMRYFGLATLFTDEHTVYRKSPVGL